MMYASQMQRIKKKLEERISDVASPQRAVLLAQGQEQDAGILVKNETAA